MTTSAITPADLWIGRVPGATRERQARRRRQQHGVSHGAEQRPGRSGQQRFGGRQPGDTARRGADQA
jgi:hypothetical protein